MKEKNHTQKNLLGDFKYQVFTFPNLEDVFKEFHTESFQKLSRRKKFKAINKTLLSLIEQTPTPCFLLGAVIDYISKINEAKLLNTPYTFSRFEFWLNHFSKLSEEENYFIRAKIVGKFIPRDSYQAFFPIGMSKVYPGTHFVCAHLSPDIDTTIASFWGWVDAFGAKVSQGRHIWSLPGGPPQSYITKAFQALLGEGVFDAIAYQTQALRMTAMDLVGKKNLIKEKKDTLASTLDHGPNEKAIIYIDDNDHYLGDWRSSDVEVVRQIVILFKSCLRWFESYLQVELISLFAKKDLTVKDLQPFATKVFDLKLEDIHPVKEFNQKQKESLHRFITSVLSMQSGLKGSFKELLLTLTQFEIPALKTLHQVIRSLPKSGLFDSQGNLIEDRPKIFHVLQTFIIALDDAVHQTCNYVERLDIVMALKQKVIGISPQYVTMESDVEEIRLKMKNFSYLTVVIPEDNDRLFPVGIIRAEDIRKNILGTVSFRDFSNYDEVKMASYLDVISIIDHHKSHLKTSAASQVLIGDAQSCNVLIAEKEFEINDKYSLGNMTKEEIEKQISSLESETKTRIHSRVIQKLLKKHQSSSSSNNYFIHPFREYCAYMSYLYAILDDTDLLSKVTLRDVECVAQILNRLKSITLQQEVEIINFDDIVQDHHFVKKAAQRILQNEDMYSLYSKIYAFKEQEVENNLKLCIEDKPSNIFTDTKEQNRCCRIGQTKMFAKNFTFYLKHADKIRARWFEKAQKVAKNYPEIDLHIHMISTIASAEEVYTGTKKQNTHKDEFWFWVPNKKAAYNHLISFLNNFQSAPEVQNNDMEVEFLGPNAPDLEYIFSHNFKQIPMKTSKNAEKGLPIAVLRFNPGTINSRKSMVSPYLPHLLT